MWVITSRHKIVFTYFRSLKFRILLVLLAVSWVPMILMSASILKSYQDRAIAARSTEVQNQCMILSNQLLSYNYMEDPSTELIDGELAQLSSLYDGRIIIIDQDFRVIKDTYGLIENKYVVSEEVIRCFKGETTNQLSEKRFIEMTVPVRAGDSNKVQGVLLVSVSTDRHLGQSGRPDEQCLGVHPGLRHSGDGGGDSAVPPAGAALSPGLLQGFMRFPAWLIPTRI